MAGVRDNTITNVASGGIASFKSVGEVPLKSLKVNFSPIQEGDGDPSPSNVRPITGWTGLKLNRDGENLWNNNDIIYGVWTSSSGDISQDRRGCRTQNIPVNGGETFTFSFNGTMPYSGSIIELDGKGAFIKRTHVAWYEQSSSTPCVCTTTANTKYIYAQTYTTFVLDMTYELLVTYVMELKLGSITTYAPYIGNQIPVSWSDLGTVYGGYVDLIKGKLVEKYGVADIDSFDYSLNTVLVGVDRYVAQKPSNCKNISNSQSCPNQVSDIYGVEAIYEANNNYSTWITTIFNNQILFYVPANTYSSIEDFKTAMSGHKIYYELITPIEYDIDPITIKSLIGQNNIWSNADSVEVQYCALESLDIYKQRFKTNEPHLENISGNIASFTTDMVSPLKECKINFLPVQASGTPSPTNVLPITGWTGCDLWRTGKNVLHKVGYSAQGMSSSTATRYASNSYGTTLSTIDPNESVIVTQSQWPSDTKTSYQNGYFTIVEDNLIFGHTYNVSIRITDITNNPLGASLDNITISNPYGDYGGSTKTVDGDRLIWRNLIYKQLASIPNRKGLEIRNCGMSFTLSDIIVTEVTDNPTPYEPYKGNKIPVLFPSTAGDNGTVYGGYVDLIRGKLVAEYGHRSIVGNESWIMSGGISGYCAYRPTLIHVLPSFSSGFVTPISDKLNGVGQYATAVYNCTINNGGNFYFGVPEELSTSAAVNAWIREIGGIDIVFPLFTPVEFDIDPIILKTLRGQNNIWSNSNGETEVKYWTHGSIADKRKVVWNQYIPQLITSNWQPQSATYASLNFDDNIATITMLQDVSQVYQSSIISKKSMNWIAGHVYYIKQDINPSETSNYCLIRANSWVGSKTCPEDEWTTLEIITSNTETRTGSTTYLGYCTVVNQSTTGKITKVRNPLLIDLTQMFGEGNQPSTVTEFKALCTKNGIDLTQYYPYDEGTELYWYF